MQDVQAVASPEGASAPLIETRGIGKAFSGVWVLKDVDFDLRPGEVHALVGENGAGKSTFVKIIAGVHPPDAGELYVEGRRVRLGNARQSEALGIRTVHQEINLVPFFDAVDNMFIGSERTRFVAGLPWLDRRGMEARARELLATLGLDLDVRRPAHLMTAPEQRIVEICRALTYRPKVVIFDEPTTALADRERERLLVVIRDLKQHLGILYVSHHLDEIFAISDRITVFRDGARVATVPCRETDEAEVIRMMVGTKSYVRYRRGESPAPNGATATPPEPAPGRSDEVLLEVRGLTNQRLEGVSFVLRRGEILGVAGVVGSGKSEVARAIYGIDRAAGEVLLKGRAIRPSPRVAVANGIAMVPEERKEQGLVLRMSLRENVTLTYLTRWARFGVTFPARERAVARRQMEALSIQARGPEQTVQYLSGGNQQKVVLGRWLAGDFEVGLFDEPTKGIDVKAKQEIYQLMDELTSQGRGIVFFSSYLPELLSVCDRVLVLRKGRVAGTFDPREEKAEERILQAMLGGGTGG